MTGSPDSTADAPDSPETDATCYCPVGGVMDLLSKRYAVQVICVVGAVGPARYGEIEAAFESVSSSTLSRRLDELAEADLLAREQYAEIPPRVEYDLTPTGEELCRRLEPLVEWVVEEENRERPVASDAAAGE
ncbi:winged helix-turn-helix transcriptional regulator [Salinilacihabitans rarus]|uniref:winged helix-turn-helix transcriptional regulator n=1 Tax=Salinilacihabitans rarus TaxID=2961596 RepID=UPI0020C86176|nr:helix-turn-helix domain-containing protein [Salinilacihabitans rarus]